MNNINKRVGMKKTKQKEKYKSYIPFLLAVARDLFDDTLDPLALHSLFVLVMLEHHLGADGEDPVTLGLRALGALGALFRFHRHAVTAVAALAGLRARDTGAPLDTAFDAAGLVRPNGAGGAGGVGGRAVHVVSLLAGLGQRRGSSERGLGFGGLTEGGQKAQVLDDIAGLVLEDCPLLFA